jgi:translocation and assembly module TamB
VRRAAWIGGALAAVAVLLAAGAVLVLRSDWLRQQVRQKIISSTESASGGRTEIGSFDFDWTAMRATVTGFTLHGTEAPARLPLFHASKITLDLTVVSFLRKDVILQRLQITQPEIHIYVDPQGRTNFPSPARADPNANPVRSLLRLKIRRVDLLNGVFEYDGRSTRFHALAEDFAAGLDCDDRGPRYLVDLAVRHVKLNDYGGIGVETRAQLEENRVTFERLVAQRQAAHVEFAGTLEGFKSPSIQGRYKASVPLTDLPLGKSLTGTAKTEGEGRWSRSGYVLQGRLEGAGLGWRGSSFALSGAALDTRYRIAGETGQAERAEFSGLVAHAWGGTWRGSARLRGWRELQLDGTVAQIPVGAVARSFQTREPPWDGTVSGPLSLSATVSAHGFGGTTAHADLAVAPLEGHLPLTGELHADWRQQEDKLRFEPSVLVLPSTRLRFSGTLGEFLTTDLVTTDLGDVESVVGLLAAQPKFRLPATLDKGEADVHVTVQGPLTDPVLDGRLAARGVKLEDARLERAEAAFHLTRAELEISRFDVRPVGAQASGSGRLELLNWTVTPESQFRTEARLRSVDLAELGKLAGSAAAVKGRMDADVRGQGTVDQPEVTVSFHLRDAGFEQERFESITGELRTRTGPKLNVEGTVLLDGTKVDLHSQFTHPRGDWEQGELEAYVLVAGLELARSEWLESLRPGLQGILSAEGDLRASLTGSGWLLRSIQGHAEAPQVSSAGRRLLRLRVDASTTGTTAVVKTRLDAGTNPIEGETRIRLAPGYPATGKVAFGRTGFHTLADLAGLRQAQDDSLPVRGFIEGSVDWSAEMARPDSVQARIEIRQLQLAPRNTQILDTQLDAGDLTIRNAAPIVMAATESGVRIERAQFVAKQTDLTLSGLYSYQSKAPWDLSLSGSVNLAVLSTFQPDLIASGMASLSASLRGDRSQPALSGRMTIENASFFLRGLPNGIEKASGTVYFERDRANIERLTGQTGGGTFNVRGFLGFGGSELTYRLLASADSIRVRYPEGVSTTLNADLNLTGSSTRSLLAGTLVVQRSGFNVRQDLGSLIAGSSNPIPVPATQNEFLRNLQFDVRLRTAPNATFQTSYTRDLQLEADLRLRGSPAKPVVLGSVKANQGEVQFFGNRYAISRGEILFFNTAAIQPSVNLDLETRVRGVTVYLSVNGPLSRLDVNYRSEPPLQSSEILALLTVGRTPTGSGSTVPTTLGTSSSTALAQTTSNSLLGGALSASVSSRVERFFGASRIKIDPNVTGVENLPQARLTIEQSLSRDVTMTFSSNLSRSSQQVVRLEWDVSKEWSMIAVRDENGSFGVDFLFRKRFR